jgi:Arc/MetJ-type ribon-helix-helix transcriptional regulator
MVEAVRRRGFSSSSSFIRSAIEDQLAEKGTALSEIEDRIAASLDRLARELRSLGTAQQAQFAMLDALVKVVLLCLPEPPADAYEPAKARAKGRYERFLRSVALNMKGDSRSALEGLVNRGD